MHLCPPCNAERFGGSNSSKQQEDEESRISADGVVINELLCFIVNKMDILTTDIIVKLCSEHFDDEDVELAKKTLFDLCSSDITRFKKRQGQNKRVNNILFIENTIHTFIS